MAKVYEIHKVSRPEQREELALSPMAVIPQDERKDETYSR